MRETRTCVDEGACDGRGDAAAAPPRRVLLIANRRSRSGGEAEAHVRRGLEAAGVRVAVPPIEARRDVAKAIEGASGVDAVVVAGGDGTLNAAAPGLLARGLPLGIVPAGTANDLARTLALPPGPDAAIDVILAGRQRAIDLGEVNGHPFFNVASFGLSVGLAQQLTREDKKRWGAFAYALAALRALTTARPFHTTIEATGIDGRSTTCRAKSWQVAVGNGVFYGGGMAVREGADIDNGMLELYSLEMERLWKLLPMALSFRAGRHGLWQEVRTLQAREIRVETRRPRKINADGELITRTPARFRVLAKALRVYAPEGRGRPANA